MNRRGMLIVLSGPSGVGKGTVLHAYLQAHPGTSLSVSATTRAPRPGERDGEHYYFLSVQEFQQKIAGGGMLEWARYNNNYYGTPRRYVEQALDLGRDVVLEIEVQGAALVRQVMPEALFIFVMPPDFNTLRGRLVGRGTEDLDTIGRRLAAAARELAHVGEYDYIVVNDDVERAARALENVIEGARNLVKLNKKFIDEVYRDAETNFSAD